jgi:hypothetical protein
MAKHPDMTFVRERSARRRTRGGTGRAQAASLWPFPALDGQPGPATRLSSAASAKIVRSVLAQLDA